MQEINLIKFKSIFIKYYDYMVEHMKYYLIKQKKMCMMNKWVMENHHFKICISVANKLGVEHREFIVMMNMKIFMKIRELDLKVVLLMRRIGSKEEIQKVEKDFGLMLKIKQVVKKILLEKFLMNLTITSNFLNRMKSISKMKLKEKIIKLKSK